MAGYDNHGMTDSSYTLPVVADTLAAKRQPQPIFCGSNDFMLMEHKKPTTMMEQIRGLGPWCRRKAANIMRKKTLYKRFPILSWLPKYTSEDAIGDLVAGITVGLTVIPQALAYSGIAGLPAAYGLYGSFLGCFVYIFLGSCKDVPIGPTAIASLLTFQTAGGVWQRAVLLAFLTGIVELLMGLFGLGFLIDFVSGPVSSGFTSAVALIIFSSQVKDIFGIKASGNTFLEMWTSILKDISNFRVGDTVMGFTCIAVLLLMRQMVSLQIGPKDDRLQSRCQKFVNKTIWLLGTARNAVLVLVCGVIGAAFYRSGYDYLKLIGDIPPGLPSFQLPPFSFEASTVNDTAGGEPIQVPAESFSEMVAHMGSGLIVVPLIALLENIAICKAFANGKTVDATQELIAIGTANIFNSFVQGYPGTGALSRGAVNNASGVRTPLGSLYTGILVILALLFFTPYFFYIPKATLGAIIIAAIVFMVEVRVVKPMWRSKKSDLVPGLAAFISCLVLPLEIGILVGIGINVVTILYHAARPKIRIDQLITRAGSKYLMVTPDRCLIFPSVDYVRNIVNKQGLRAQVPLVMDCSHIYGADFTAANVIGTLTADFSARGQGLIFYNLKPSIVHVFEGVETEIRNFYDIESLEKAIDDASVRL